MIPKEVVFNITFRCQLKCTICTVVKTGEKNRELMTGDVIRIMQDLSASGVTVISFTGGDLFMREDIKEILLSARRLFKEVKITTNGVELLSFADFLFSLPLDNICISLDGDNPQTHDAIRGKGVYAGITNFLQYAKNKKNSFEKPYISINTVIVQQNIAQLLRIVALAESWGCASITYQVFLYNNTMFKEKNIDNIFWVKETDMSLLAAQINSLIGLKQEKKTKIFIANTLPYLTHICNYYENNLKPEAFTCRNGFDVITMSPQGEISICDFHLGSLLNNTFLNIWHGDNVKKALDAVAFCEKPCMMNCFGGIEKGE